MVKMLLIKHTHLPWHVSLLFWARNTF